MEVNLDGFVDGATIGAAEGLAALFEAMPEAVVIADSKRRLRWVNSSFERMFGYHASDLIGQDIRMVYARQEDYEEQGRQRYTAPSQEADPRFRVECRRKSGEVFLGDVSATPIFGEGGVVIGTLGIVRDITRSAAFEGLLAELYSISSSQELGSDDKVRSMLRLGCDYYALPTAIVSMIDEQEYFILFAESSEAEIETGTTFDLKDTYCVDTLAANGPVGFNEASASDLAEHPCYQQLGLESYIGIPLIVDGERFGTLNFSGTEARQPFGSLDYELIKVFSAWISQELSRKQAMDRLMREAHYDDLTGTLSRAPLLRKLRAALSARATEPPASLILFDLDHFKRINDIYGHVVGDHVLRSIAETARSVCRSSDYVGRLGGEEFAILCQGASLQAARNLAERLRTRIAQQVVTSGEHEIRVTVSAGVASAPDAHSTVEAWLDAADQALYRAKRSGRDAVFTEPGAEAVRAQV